MPLTDPAASLGALVAERPARAELFETLRLDYCCGGAQTLADACAQRGLDPDTVRAQLDALDGDTPGQPDPREDRDWRQASLVELCAHIERVHHGAGLRAAFPRIAHLLATVVRVHGGDHAELHDLERHFAGLRRELEQHIDLEERLLFPACRALERGTTGAELDARVLALLEHEHSDTGDALAALRELADDYDPARALCETHRLLLDALRGLELDLHRHIHEENNLLFPRALALAGVASAEPSGGDDGPA